MCCAGVGPTELSVRLAAALDNGSVVGVERVLAAGISPDRGPPGGPPPIIRAACLGHVDILKLLIHRGADLELTYTNVVSESRLSLEEARAVHAAIHCRHIDALRVLLQAGADPNSADGRGGTPLMAVFYDAVPPEEQLEMIQVILSAGGDLLRANQVNGGLPIHYAADSGATSLMGTLVSSAPAALHTRDCLGMSPLAAAASEGYEDTVSALLSLGATDNEGWDLGGTSALREAVVKGKEKVVRVLLEEGLQAVGGLSLIPQMLLFSVERGNLGILRHLLNVEGEDAQKRWANTRVLVGRRDLLSSVTPEPILHVAASYCSCRVVSMLLSTGAEESATAAHDNRASDVVGDFVDAGADKVAREAALGRMLQRAPAFRARSWAWPTHPAAPAGSHASAVHSIPRSARSLAQGVQVLRRKEPIVQHKVFLEGCDGRALAVESAFVSSSVDASSMCIFRVAHFGNERSNNLLVTYPYCRELG